MSEHTPPPYCYEFPRPAVTVDLVVFALEDNALRVLLIRRKSDPFAGCWAIPGGFLGIDEPVETAARRELHEETGLEVDGRVSFVGYFDDPGRDPRGRTISFVFAAVLAGSPPTARGADDAAEARWINPFTASNLAFDHDTIVAKALDWLMSMIPFGSGALQLLPEAFSTADLATLCQAVHLEEEKEGDLLNRLSQTGIIVPSEGCPGRYKLAV
jgi:8-oxo-dGTP diphosphatase